MPFVTKSWLADHVEVSADATVEDIAASLVKVGIEEEEIFPAAVTGPLVAGKVLTVESKTQSNGKDIRYCRVDVGEYNDAPGTGAEQSELPSRGIVCGAHNFEVGDSVVVVLPGAVLPGPFPISARKTYGHVSDGMICSERELGMGDDHDGIIVLGKTVPVEEIPEPGTDMIPILDLGEEVLEVNVTPDRGYCFAMRGLAREYAHSTGVKFDDPGVSGDLGVALAAPEDVAADADTFDVTVDEGSEREGRAAADRFVTLIVRGIDPNAKTPSWMVHRLEQAGMRSLGLSIDVTNYVMLDLGQPLHAYDIRAVAEPFVVRRARDGEPFTTLDGTERKLDSEDIVITDSPDGPASRIVGLAGVMGGLNSEVEDDTTDVVIEAAHFDNVSIARTSRRHRLVTESSKRFERGVDPQLAPVAAARVAQLLAEYGGGQISEVGIDLNETGTPSPVRMHITEPRRLTGVDYAPAEVVRYLEEIGCDVEEDGADLVVTPPTWRPDLVGPAHLVEEIARLDGYDKIPTRVAVGPGSMGLSPLNKLRRQAAQVLATSGLVEVKAYPFMGDAHDRQQIPVGDSRRNAVRLRNPLADDAPLLRTSLLDTLLEVAERNASRGVIPLALFEVGQVAVPAGTVPSEILGVERRPSDEELKVLLAGVPSQPWHVAGVVGGQFARQSGAQMLDGDAAVSPWGWADALEAARSAAASVGVNVESSRAWVPEGTQKLRGAPVPASADAPEDVAPFHPGRSANLFVRTGRGFKVVGRAGELHPKVVEEYGLPARSAAFELDLDVVSSTVRPGFLQVKPVSTYPPVKEDLAIVVDDYISAREVETVIRRGAGGLLESLVLFDIYSGAQIKEGARSLAYSLTLRAPDRTLSAEEVGQIRTRIISDVEKKLKATVRTA